MKGLILAGGPGSGLRPLTLNTPKPILPIANRPIVLYQLDTLKGAGVHEILISLSYQPRKIEDLLKDGADFGTLVRYAREKSALGPLGAFLNARDWIDGPTVVLGAGMLTSIDLSEAATLHRESGAVATFVLSADGSEKIGIRCDDSGRVTHVPENGSGAGSGIAIFEPSLVDDAPNTTHDADHDAIGTLFRAGLPVFIHRAEAYWTRIDSPATYLDVHRDILSGALDLNLHPEENGGSGAAPGSLIAPGVSIGEGACVESSVVGPNCSIAAGARIVDSVIWSGNTIGENAIISGSVLGRGCFVGASVVLPPGTVLGGKSSITEYSRF